MIALLAGCAARGGTPDPDRAPPPSGLPAWVRSPGYGSAVAFIDDADGDGVPDFAVGSPGARPDAEMGRGAVAIHSGRTGDLLRLIPRPAAPAAVRDDGGFGESLAAMGDWNDDGAGDLLVGEAGRSPRGAANGAGVACVLSPRSGELLWLRVGEGNLHSFGHAAAAVPVPAGGRTAEFAVSATMAYSATASDRHGQVVIVSAHRPPLTLLGPRREASGFGGAIAFVGDHDGVGVADLAVGAEFAMGRDGRKRGGVYVVSGLTGDPIASIPGEPPEVAFGRSIAATADVTGDGVPDLIVGAPGAALPPASPVHGRVTILSGGRWERVRVLVGASAGDGFGDAVGAAGDLDGDGVPDIVVGAPAWSGSGVPEGGRIAAFSGATGSPLWTSDGFEPRGRLGAAIAAGVDVDGDGVPDVLAGAPGSSPAPGEPGTRGNVAVMSGRDGGVLLTTGR